MMKRISVVVICRNEVRNIQECIEAIYASEVEDNVQLNVFIVDGMSDDGTREKIAALRADFPTLRIIDNEEQLTPYAFNLGIHAADYDYIQIVGARHILSANYVQKCLDKLDSDSSAWCVGGRIENEYLNENGKVIATAMGTPLGMGIGNFRTLNASGYIDTVTSPMYPRFVFEKIGYFDEDLIRNQDDDFNFRVSKAGGKIYFENDIQLTYYVRGTYPGLWRQFFQYGYWKVFVNKKHKAVTTMRQLVPPAFVGYLLLAFLFSWFLPVLALPLLFYLGLVACVSFILSAKEKLPISELILTFFILHVSYGLGYLKGIWEFLLLKKKPSNKQKRLSR
jgi:GT2 family glycosyltransferase